MSAPQLVFTWHDWVSLFTHFLGLSLMSLGGAISTTSEMQRYLVERQGWLTPAQFGDSVALAQSSPGPNVLFVALLGWNVGLNNGSTMAALCGVVIAAHRNRGRRAVRAFKQGMAPLVIAMLLSTAWLLASGGATGLDHWPLWLLSAASCIVIWRTRLHLLWMLAAGAVLGALQLV
jgi:chromate transporter